MSKKLVIINQAANYLTVGFANAFNEKFDKVVLISGSVHVQGEELQDDIEVHYINKWHESPASKKIFSYLKALVRMWFLLCFKYRKYDVLFVSVPPMGYLLNLIVSNKFSMVIWDVYPDTFKITGMKETHFVYKLWSKLNRLSFKKAYRFYTISERMADLLEQYVDRKKIIIQPIWSIFQQNDKVSKSENPFISKHNLQGKFIIQYSGNIGLTHNVEILIDLALILKDEKDILFQIIGRGPRKNYLERMVKEKNLPNCMFLPFQSDDMFPYSLSAADVGVVILDESTSKGSVPSKSYNLMSYGIPSLYIASADSQLKLYADQYAHAASFTKNNLEAAAEFIKSLRHNAEFYIHTSKNAVEAATDFRRSNADKFAEKYFW